METTPVTITTPMGLFGPAASPAQGTQASADLALRLRADTSGDLRRELVRQLDGMQTQLRTQAERGADAPRYQQIQAGLLAVGAARDILDRMPVSTVGHQASRPNH